MAWIVQYRWIPFQYIESDGSYDRAAEQIDSFPLPYESMKSAMEDLTHHHATQPYWFPQMHDAKSVLIDMWVKDLADMSVHEVALDFHDHGRSHKKAGMFLIGQTNDDRTPYWMKEPGMEVEFKQRIAAMLDEAEALLANLKMARPYTKEQRENGDPRLTMDREDIQTAFQRLYDATGVMMGLDPYDPEGQVYRERFRKLSTRAERLELSHQAAWYGMSLTAYRRFLKAEEKNEQSIEHLDAKVSLFDSVFGPKSEAMA